MSDEASWLVASGVAALLLWLAGWFVGWAMRRKAARLEAAMREAGRPAPAPAWPRPTPSRTTGLPPVSPALRGAGARVDRDMGLRWAKLAGSPPPPAMPASDPDDDLRVAQTVGELLTGGVSHETVTHHHHEGHGGGFGGGGASGDWGDSTASGCADVDVDCGGGGDD